MLHSNTRSLFVAVSRRCSTKVPQIHMSWLKRPDESSSCQLISMTLRITTSRTYDHRIIFHFYRRRTEARSTSGIPVLQTASVTLDRTKYSLSWISSPRGSYSLDKTPFQVLAKAQVLEIPTPRSDIASVGTHVEIKN